MRPAASSTPAPTTLDILAVHLGMLNVDFIVIDAPELVTHLLALAGRYARAAAR